GHDPKNGSHGTADHLMMTGHKFNAALPFACYGSVVAKERGYRDGMIPFVQLGRAIDRRFNGGIAGFLGDEFNPFEVPHDPSPPGRPPPPPPPPPPRGAPPAPPPPAAPAWRAATPSSPRSIGSTRTPTKPPPPSRRAIRSTRRRMGSSPPRRRKRRST